MLLLQLVLGCLQLAPSTAPSLAHCIHSLSETLVGFQQAYFHLHQGNSIRWHDSIQVVLQYFAGMTCSVSKIVSWPNKRILSDQVLCSSVKRHVFNVQSVDPKQAGTYRRYKKYGDLKPEH